MNIPEQIAEYQRNHDRRLLSRLVVAYLPLVKSIVARKFPIPPLGMDRDDLDMFGCEGLIAAIQRFEPRKTACSFGTYAFGRIHFAILDGIRREGPFKRRQDPIPAYSLEQNVPGTDSLTFAELVAIEDEPKWIAAIDDESMRRQLAEAMAQLTRPMREAVTLRYVEEMSWRDVAERMMMSEQGAFNAGKRGTDRLRALLEA